jgi:hypothetical protein
VTPKRSRLTISDVERDVVTLFGTEYELANCADLSAVDIQKFQRKGKRLDELIRADRDLTEAEETELVGLLDSICRRVLVAPDELHARLRDVHRIQVAALFFQLLAATIAAAGATAPAGETSSPPSVGSTAPIPS